MRAPVVALCAASAALAVALVGGCQTPPERTLCAAAARVGSDATCRLRSASTVTLAPVTAAAASGDGARVAVVAGGVLRRLDLDAADAGGALLSEAPLAAPVAGDAALAFSSGQWLVIERDGEALVAEMFGPDGQSWGPPVPLGLTGGVAPVRATGTPLGFAVWVGRQDGGVEMIALDASATIYGGPLAFEPGEVVSIDGVAGGPAAPALVYRELAAMGVWQALFAPLGGQGTRTDIVPLGEGGPLSIAALGLDRFAVLQAGEDAATLWWLERGQPRCATALGSLGAVQALGAAAGRPVAFTSCGHGEGGACAIALGGATPSLLPLPHAGLPLQVAGRLFVLPQAEPAAPLEVVCGAEPPGDRG